MIRIEARLAEAQDAERRTAARVEELTEALEAAKTAESAAGESDLEAKLEALSWKEAASRKCDFSRDAPADLVQVVRSAKGGVKGKAHHFTAHASEAVLFRYARSGKA